MSRSINLIFCLLAMIVPVAILPHVLDNCFERPKTILIFLGVSAALLVHIARGDKQITDLHKMIVPMAGVIALNFLSLLYTQNPYYTKVAVSLNLSCLAAFYLVAAHGDPIRLLSFIAAGGVLVSIVSGLQVFGIYFPLDYLSPGGMIIGTIGNSNFLGAYLLFPLYAALGLGLTGRRWSWLAVGIILFAFIAARARASWLGFGVSLPVFLFFAKGRVRWGIFIIPLILGTFMAAMPSRFSVSRIMDSESLRFRVTKYSPAAVYLFKESPLLGHGLWSYRNQVYRAQAELGRDDEGYFRDYPNPKPRRVHNDYLEFLVEGGIVYALALAVFLVSAMRAGWKRARNGDQAALSAFASIIAILVAAVFFFPFHLGITLFMTCLMLGILAHG